MEIRTLNHQIDLYQGSYLEVPLYIAAYDDAGDPAYLDITAATITAKFRLTPASTALISLSGATIVPINVLQGAFKLIFLESATSALPKENVTLTGHVEVSVGGKTYRTHQLTTYFKPEYNY